MANYEVVSGCNCDGSKSLTINVFGKELIVWGIDTPTDDLYKQLDLITSISSDYKDVVNHLKINGYDA